MATSVLNQVYEISAQIENMYAELLYNDFYTKNLTKRHELIRKIRALVIQEYNLLRTMSLEELNLYFEGKAKPIKKYPHRVNERVYNKMLNLNSHLNENDYITGKELGISSIPSNMCFSMYDVIISMIEIDVIKRLREKIYSLIITNEQDFIFTQHLKNRLRNSAFDLLYHMSTAEMIALTYSGSIKAMPRISKTRIQNNLKGISKNFSSDDIEEVLESYARSTIDRMAKVEVLENNVKDVFNYLVDYTRLEVLVNTCSMRRSLESMSNYCTEISSPQNVDSLMAAKRLIKSRTDSIL